MPDTNSVYMVVLATPEELDAYLYDAWNEVEDTTEPNDTGRVVAIIRSADRYYATNQEARFWSGLIFARIAGSLSDAVQLRDQIIETGRP